MRLPPRRLLMTVPWRRCPESNSSASGHPRSAGCPPFAPPPAPSRPTDDAQPPFMRRPLRPPPQPSPPRSRRRPRKPRSPARRPRSPGFLPAEAARRGAGFRTTARPSGVRPEGCRATATAPHSARPRRALAESSDRPLIVAAIPRPADQPRAPRRGRRRGPACGSHRKRSSSC